MRPLVLTLLVLSGIVRALPTVSLVEDKAFGWEASAYLERGWLELAWCPATATVPSDVAYASLPVAWAFLVAAIVLLWRAMHVRRAGVKGFAVELSCSATDQSPAAGGHRDRNRLPPGGV